MAVKVAFQIVDKASVHQVWCADVDTDGEVLAGFPPDVHPVDGLFQHPLAQGSLQVAVFHNGQKLTRRNQALFRVVPADQRLETKQLAVGNPDLGLEKELEFLIFERPADFHQLVATVPAMLIQAGVEEVILVTALFFC